MAFKFTCIVSIRVLRLGLHNSIISFALSRCSCFKYLSHRFGSPGNVSVGGDVAVAACLLLWKAPLERKQCHLTNNDATTWQRDFCIMNEGFYCEEILNRTDRNKLSGMQITRYYSYFSAGCDAGHLFSPICG